MTSQNHNAFLRRSADGDPAPRHSLAGLLAPMRASIEPRPHGFSLALDPIRALDALRPWARIAPEEGSLTLVTRLRPAAPRLAEGDAAAPLAALAAAREIAVIERFGPDQLLVDRLALAQLVGAAGGDGLSLVLVDGPVDAGDAGAIARALATGQSPLEAEIRAVAAMHLVRDRSIIVDVRKRTDAAAFVAENFRHYLAALQSRPAAEYTAPEWSLVDRLLDRNGRLTVRAIETEVYSTSIDIGVNSSADGAIRPADTSLIYDLLSRTWHGE